jgi:hypothetical protein
MLLAVDAGNTNVVFSVHDGAEWRGRWRIRTEAGATLDAVGKAAILVGIVGEDQGDLAVSGRCAAERGPAGGECGDEGHAVAAGLVGGDRALGRGVEKGLALEADRTGEDAAIHFGEGNVHRDVGGGEAACPCRPCRFRAAGKDNLKDGSIVDRERVVGRGVTDMRRRHGK